MAYNSNPAQINFSVQGNVSVYTFKELL
jgi:hypothetical protein